ncbi:hypothetical protein P886_3315 [Alteromonadaceae bacterium 2753L.S.0a.02]|nr:hypothetical protein P886_3315 [Alteromonadaceae bacterium 2753L.S.0a.02]
MPNKRRSARRDAAPLDSEFLAATERIKLVLTGPKTFIGVIRKIGTEKNYYSL